jgi:SAM-dependent methyltransferase
VSQRSEFPADRLSGRQPTSHERLSGQPWDASYHDGPAPWDTGQPQPAVVRLAADGAFAAEFTPGDALRLERLGRAFDTVLDCGLFHSLDGDERAEYVAGLASVTKHGGTVYVLCFSDEGPDTGPHPVSRDELTAAFTPGTGWNVIAIERTRVQTGYRDANGAPAWLATIKRI